MADALQCSRVTAMSKNKNHRPSQSRLDVGDMTERTAIPPGLRYQGQGQTSVSEPTVRVQKSAEPQMNRRPKATPAPVDDSMKSNIIPFSRPKREVAMVVASPVKPAVTVSKNTLPLGSTPAVNLGPSASPQQPVRAAVMVTQPAPGQSPVAAVFSQQPNGTFAAAVAVAPVQHAQAQPQQTPANVFPTTQFPVPTLPATTGKELVVQGDSTIAEVKHDSLVKTDDKWLEYEKLGLGKAALQKVHQGTSKIVVSAYRLLGFGILTLIVMLLVGYISESIFYFVSDSWVQPMIVSKSDEKVVQLQSQLAEQKNNRDRIASDLAQAEKIVQVQEEFQGEYVKAIKADMNNRRAALNKMRGLAKQYASARGSITSTNKAYADVQAKRLAEEYAAGLVDQHAMMNGNFQSAQIATANLGLQEREIDMEQKADDLEQQTASLDALVTSKDGSSLSYDVLKIKQDYENSKLEQAKAVAMRDSLKSSLARQDEIIKNLESSGILKAIKDDASVAFVPYANMKGVEPGATLYGCKLGMVVCHKVGKVIEVLPGEMQSKHPHRDKMLRGQLVEIQLMSGESAAQDDVLFVGGKPMGF